MNLNFFALPWALFLLFSCFFQFLRVCLCFVSLYFSLLVFLRNFFFLVRDKKVEKDRKGDVKKLGVVEGEETELGYSM